MAKHTQIQTIKINPYEIAKASDMDAGFQSFLGNIGMLTGLVVSAKRDFIIGGNVRPGDNLNVIVEPFIAYCKNTEQLYCKATETSVELNIASTKHDRIDVITISGDGWDLSKKERRAKWYVTENAPTGNNLTNDGLVFGEFFKRQQQNINIKAIKGVDNKEKAENIATNEIKIAEIKILASRQGLDNKDIFFVEANKDGDANQKWTVEKFRTFYVPTISESLQKFFKIHKNDGTLKNGVVGKNNLALSGGDVLTSADISLGKRIDKRAEKYNPVTGKIEAIKPIVGNYILEFSLLASTKITETFEVVLDTLLYMWSIFIESDVAALNNAQNYTDDEVEKLSNELNTKLEKEKQERISADKTEKQERTEADKLERQERIKADETEKKERTEADNLEKQERIKGDENVKTFAINEINETLPVGFMLKTYTSETTKFQKFLQLDGSSFNPNAYNELYQYWSENLNIFGVDENDNPLLPNLTNIDESNIGQICKFIGQDYHYQFLECNGLPFSPDVYKDFYQKYWLPYFSHLGRDETTGWPLRPQIKSEDNIHTYIRVFPSGDDTNFFIKSLQTK